VSNQLTSTVEGGREGVLGGDCESVDVYKGVRSTLSVYATVYWCFYVNLPPPKMRSTNTTKLYFSMILSDLDSIFHVVQILAYTQSPHLSAPLNYNAHRAIY
jgi:hypothetical protein